jgi:hypothetical protein
MNTRFVIRGLILALPLATIGALIGVVGLHLGGYGGPPLEPTPPPPAILVPRGQLPAGVRVFQEWARYRGESYTLVGCGFLLQLADGQVVGVTTAHSVSLGQNDHPLEQIGLRIAGRDDLVAEFSNLHGRPGRPRTGDDVTVDYLLLHLEQPVDAGLLLQPDGRGQPQPGERVVLFSGLAQAQHGQQHVLAGTVQSANHRAIWVVMDDWFNPGLMSGSAFLSQHSGRVVGMLIAGTLRGGRVLLAAHPIGSIVRLAQVAIQFPPLADAGRQFAVDNP